MGFLHSEKDTPCDLTLPCYYETRSRDSLRDKRGAKRRSATCSIQISRINRSHIHRKRVVSGESTVCDQSYHMTAAKNKAKYQTHSKLRYFLGNRHPCLYAKRSHQPGCTCPGSLFQVVPSETLPSSKRLDRYVEFQKFKRKSSRVISRVRS